MKNNLLTPVIVIFGLALLGLLSFHGEVAAMALPLVVYIGAALKFAPDGIDIGITRETSGSERVSAETPVTIRVAAHNSGAAVEELLLSDPLPSDIEPIEGATTVLAPLPADGDLELNYTVRARRGDYSITHVEVKAGEGFGLFWRELRLASPLELRVKPVLSKMKSIPLEPPETHGFWGQFGSRQGGYGVEFFSVRHYHPGDPLRRLNWKMAARHPDKLYANTYRLERSADIGLILDARSHVNILSGADSLFEHAVQATADAAAFFLAGGNRVGLLVFSGAVRSVFPGFGKFQLECILKELAKARLGRNYSLKNLGHLPTRLFPARSQIVMFSNCTSEDIPTLRQLRARGYGVMLICPDGVDFEIKAYQSEGGAPGKPLQYARRLVRAQRDFLLRKIRRAGIQTVDWKVSTPLPQVIRQSLQRQTVRRHPSGAA
jgi:uncharacterized protein (DUF58 family)